MSLSVINFLYQTSSSLSFCMIVSMVIYIINSSSGSYKYLTLIRGPNKVIVNGTFEYLYQKLNLELQLEHRN
jgi:hypothetical protein